jgi:hypothetical protein
MGADLRQASVCQSDFSGGNLRHGAARSFKIGALFDRGLAGAPPGQARGQSHAATSTADFQSSAFPRKALA